MAKLTKKERKRLEQKVAQWKESQDPAYLKLKKELETTGTIKTPKSKGSSMTFREFINIP